VEEEERQTGGRNQPTNRQWSRTKKGRMSSKSRSVPLLLASHALFLSSPHLLLLIIIITK
jgi:hypothetical protein